MTEQNHFKVIQENNSAVVEVVKKFLSEDNSKFIKDENKIEELKQTVKKFEEKKENFLVKITDLQKLLLHNISEIQKFVFGIKEPLDIFLQSKDSTSNLGNRGTEIEDIVKTVAKIADNTNLLSFNAAIEAAQAGQYGKGFSVVSGVIRKLAGNTEKLTRDIRGFTNEVQDGLKKVVTDFNEATSFSKEIITLGEEITNDMNNIEKGTADESLLFDDIVKLYKEYDEHIFEIVGLTNTIIEVANEDRDKLRGVYDIYLTQHSEPLSSGSADGEIENSKVERTVIQELVESQNNFHAISEDLLTELQEEKEGRDTLEKKITERYELMEQVEIKFGEKYAAIIGSISDLNEIYMKDRDILEDMIMKVSDITSLTDKANIKIKTLKEFIRKIDRLVDNVIYITIQINLLSVNGAIEAARAGEAGKGFATVSMDVQEMAEASSSHASTIKDLLWDVQGELIIINEEVNHGVIIAKQRSSKISLSMAQIDKVSLEIAELIAKISEVQQAFAQLIQQKNNFAANHNSMKDDSNKWFEKVVLCGSEIKRVTKSAEEFLEQK